MKPQLIDGNCHQDIRGSLKYNNDFNASAIKRIYVIENADTELKRGWQGHKIEQRWFSAVSGKFEVLIIAPDDWLHPSENLDPYAFEISSEALNVLHVPSGYISCIQALEENSKLLVMADYNLGEIQDEYKFPLTQFQCTKI